MKQAETMETVATVFVWLGLISTSVCLGIIFGAVYGVLCFSLMLLYIGAKNLS